MQIARVACVKPGDDPLASMIRSLLAERGNRVLAVKDIFERLRASHPGLTQDGVAAAVEAMEREGELIAVRGKRYSLPEFTPYLSGVIRVHPDGDGLVRVDGDRPPVKVDRRSMRGAMNGDLVLVRVDKDARKTKIVRGREVSTGEVFRILRRAHRMVVGRFHADPNTPWIRPFDTRIDSDIFVDPQSTMGARQGEMVNVEIERYPSATADAYGRIVEVLGMIGDPGVDIEVVIRKYSIPHEFPVEVIAAAESIPLDVSQAEIAAREDLRERQIVTIDGETAKDFDDAVEVTRLENGNHRLGVHIADVAHYVREGSTLDREAFERGTSVYFPGRAVPMLPERLSNGICSLNPRVDRLTFSVEVEIDGRGRFVDRRIFKSVIRTVERMTYTEVNAILTDPTALLEERYGHLLPLFGRMRDLYEILRRRREARGSIDFDLPEADVLLGEEGEIESIRASERNIAHRLIEELMLVANEIVAQQLIFAAQPGVFRVHEPPDFQKLSDLKTILKEFRHSLRADPEDVRPGELQRVLHDIAGTPEERFLSEIILRTMKRAFYLEEPIGHFALALQHYCHFTSPIRRYPDLIVHRMLGELLADGPMTGDRRDRIDGLLPAQARQSSERERRAEEAEREVLEWKKVIFMRDKIGLEFPGRVTGVVAFGLFVELDEIFVQGLVPVASIGGDFWLYLDREHRLRGESSGRELRLGDRVVVQVRQIDEDRRQIELRLLEIEGAAALAGRERDRSRRRR
ncbi:MAG TPA: ribonuclease R [Thermoanaerobaculia bacterium]|nr:ribonuclease R [Thermoanaerobaculia bacterium]